MRGARLGSAGLLTAVLVLLVALGCSASARAATVPASPHPRARPVQPALSLQGGRSPFKLASSTARGIVPRRQGTDLRVFPRFASSQAAMCSASCAGPLLYHEGEVMRSVKVYLLLWEPPSTTVNGQTGTSFEKAPEGYLGEIETFLKDVASASGTLGNVYSVDSLYGDATPGEYHSEFGGAFVDSKLYPARIKATCPTSAEAEGAPPENQPCISDGKSLSGTWHLQLGEEVLRYVSEYNALHPTTPLATGMKAIYFMLMPPHVNSCSGFEGGVPACNTNVYCAYHTAVQEEGGSRRLVVYANMPYDHVPGCETPNSTPSGDEINTLSHEDNEAVTDPLGAGWYDYSGNEVADKCTYPFFDPSEDANEATDAYGLLLGGSSGASAYNQEIAGGRYLLQREWSNAAGGCVTRAPRVNASFVVTQQSETELTFDGGPSSTEAGQITEYVWSFSAGSGPLTGQTVKHSFPGPGTYKATLSVKNDSGETGAGEQEVTINVGSGGFVTSTSTTTTTITRPAVTTTQTSAVTTSLTFTAAPITTTATTTATAAVQPPHAYTANEIAKLLGLPANGKRLSGLGTIFLGRAECPPACAVTLKLSAKVTGRSHGRRVTRWKQIGFARVKGTPKGAVYVKAPGPGMRELDISLSSAGRALLRKHHSLTVRLLVSVEESSGATWPIERRLTLTSGAKSARHRSRAARRRR